jgi:rubredoxin-NAD+ reductase
LHTTTLVFNTVIAALFCNGKYSIKYKAKRIMKIWQCLVCGLVYEEAKGWPEDGIEPGTRWEDVPADWACPECGASKAMFEMVEF